MRETDGTYEKCANGNWPESEIKREVRERRRERERQKGRLRNKKARIRAVFSPWIL